MTTSEDTNTSFPQLKKNVENNVKDHFHLTDLRKQQRDNSNLDGKNENHDWKRDSTAKHQLECYKVSKSLNLEKNKENLLH